MGRYVNSPALDFLLPPTSRQRYQISNQIESASVELTDDGSIISYEEYFPFGATSFHSVSGSIDVSAKRYRYTGKERDEETALYYHGARYYAAWLGRWTAVDPSGIKDGPNRYAYVRNAPIQLVDLTGNESTWFGKAVATVKQKVEAVAKAPDPMLEVAKTAASTVQHVKEATKALADSPAVKTAEAYQKQIYSTAAQAIGSTVKPGAEVVSHAVHGDVGGTVAALASAEVEYHPVAFLAKAGLAVVGAVVALPSNVSAAASAKTPEERGKALANTVIAAGTLILAAEGGAKGIGGAVEGGAVGELSEALRSSSGSGRSLPSTGVSRFDQLVVGTKVFDKWKATLEGRGWKVDVRTLQAGSAAEIESGKIAVDPSQFRFIDLLHESRHVAQITRAEARGVAWANTRYTGLFETGAYTYEQRLAQKFGFSEEYQSFLSRRVSDYWTKTVEQAFRRSATMKGTWY